MVQRDHKLCLFRVRERELEQQISILEVRIIFPPSHGYTELNDQTLRTKSKMNESLQKKIRTNFKLNMTTSLQNCVKKSVLSQSVKPSCRRYWLSAQTLPRQSK